MCHRRANEINIDVRLFGMVVSWGLAWGSKRFRNAVVLVVTVAGALLLPTHASISSGGGAPRAPD